MNTFLNRAIKNQSATALNVPSIQLSSIIPPKETHAFHKQPINELQFTTFPSIKLRLAIDNNVVRLDRVDNCIPFYNENTGNQIAQYLNETDKRATFVYV